MKPKHASAPKRGYAPPPVKNFEFPRDLGLGQEPHFRAMDRLGMFLQSAGQAIAQEQQLLENALVVAAAAAHMLRIHDAHRNGESLPHSQGDSASVPTQAEVDEVTDTLRYALRYIDFSQSALVRLFKP